MLVLVPKTVSESCITNDTCQVECIESFSYHIQVDTKHVWLLQSEAVVQNALNSAPRKSETKQVLDGVFPLFHELCSFYLW